jgi:hypothetical protein
MSRVKSIARMAAASLVTAMLSWAGPTAGGEHQPLGDRQLFAYGKDPAVYSIGIGFSY